MPQEQAPSHLSPASKALWLRVVHDYEFAAPDLVTLRLWLEQLDVAERARRAVQRDGMFIPGRFGKKVHPGVVTERNAVLAASRLLRQLDLPELAELPVARPQVLG